MSAQAVEQQKPSTQKPAAHSSADLHSAPAAAFGLHVPSVQLKPARQGCWSSHVASQAPPTHGLLHTRVVACRQTPTPSQVRWEYSVDPAQAGSPHWVSGVYLRQAPSPLQVPSWAQDQIGSWVQSLPGSWPAGTLRHRPSEPGSLHEWHFSVQALSQQIPDAQKPDAHWRPLRHARPLSSMAVGGASAGVGGPSCLVVTGASTGVSGAASYSSSVGGKSCGRSLAAGPQPAWARTAATPSRISERRGIRPTLHEAPRALPIAERPLEQNLKGSAPPAMDSGYVPRGQNDQPTFRFSSRMLPDAELLPLSAWAATTTRW